MAAFRPTGRRRHPVPPPSAHAGGDASRFAAANLPPYKTPPAGGTGRDNGETGVEPELLAARAAAAQYDALYDSGPPRRRSPYLMLALVFAIGTGAGLAGARWFASAPKHPSFAVPPVALSAPAATTVDPDGQARALRGIRPSELPYDGRVSEQGDEDTADEAKSTPAQAPAGPSAKAPAGQDANGFTAPAAAASRLPQATASEQQQPVRDSGREKAETHAATAKPSKRAEAPSRKAVGAVKSGKGKENDKEIERMRRQADDELTRKTAAVSRDEPRRSSEPSRLQQVSAALASCDRRSNIILREHCRWQVCNGMWGKNGCPSYASARKDPYAY